PGRRPQPGRDDRHAGRRPEPPGRRRRHAARPTAAAMPRTRAAVRAGTRIPGRAATGGRPARGRLMQTDVSPVLRDIVLVGGGHSHAMLLRMFAMQPMPGVRLTLIGTDTDTPYS